MESNPGIETSFVTAIRQASTTFSPTSAPSSFLAFLGGSHLEATNRLLAEKSESKPLDLGCAQFNFSYHRRHLPPTLPQLGTRQQSKKSFCWRPTLDEIMKGSGKECDEILKVEERLTKFTQHFSEDSPLNPSHSRFSNISSYATCIKIESPVPAPISPVEKLQPKDISKPTTLSRPISKSLDPHAILSSSPLSLSSCKSSSFTVPVEDALDVRGPQGYKGEPLYLLEPPTSEALCTGTVIPSFYWIIELGDDQQDSKGKIIDSGRGMVSV